jgi:hypothetical protein
MSSSVVINMHCAPVELEQFDPENPGMAMTLARDAIRKWAARCTL